MDISFENALSEVRVVDSDRSYWFVRTYRGQLYDYFREHNFIGLGLNRVPFNYINEAVDDVTFKRLSIFIDGNTDYKKGEATKWANQLISFQHQIKLNDIVIIPDEDSINLSFGLVVSDPYAVDVKQTFKFGDSFEPYPEKRRRIKWLKEIPRAEFRGALNSIFFSHTAIRNIDDFSQVIEGNLSGLYIKDEHIYLSLKIDQDEEINAFELERFLGSLTFFYKELCKEYGEIDNEELYIKIKVQSKGNMFLKAVVKIALVALAGAMVLADDPEVKLDLGIFGKIDLKGKGLLKSWNEFLDGKQKRQVEWQNFLDSREKLKAKPVQNSVSKQDDAVTKTQ